MELDQFQQAAATSREATLSIAAPAGSGKTRVLVERVAWLIQKKNARPKHIVVVTFARKAAHELSERLIARGCAGVTVKTFHAWALWLIQRQHIVAGRLITGAEQWLLQWKLAVQLIHGTGKVSAKKILATCNWSEPFLLRELLESVATLRNAGVALEDERLMKRARAEPFAALVQLLYAHYTKLLLKNGAADFAYLVQAALMSARRVAPNYQHVLVDEVQDASSADLRMIDRYCARADTRTWVGDPNQALYGWRGSAGNIPNGATCNLRYNYRSDGAVIAFVNRFLSAGTSGTLESIIAHRPSLQKPHSIMHPRYGDDHACCRILSELTLGSTGYSERDVVILARAHHPLRQLIETKKKFPGVRLATVHAFKGLEAPVVIVLNTAQNRFGFPLAGSNDELPLSDLTTYDRVREERNIFYVAVTRARDVLVLCAPESDPTPFLDELPKKTYRRAILDE